MGRAAIAAAVTRRKIKRRQVPAPQDGHERTRAGRARPLDTGICVGFNHNQNKVTYTVSAAAAPSAQNKWDHGDCSV